MLGAPTGAERASASCKQNQLDILYAFLGGRNVGGHARLPARAADPLRPRRLLLVRRRRRAVSRARACSASRRSRAPRCAGELPLSSPIYELDGTSAGSRDPATRPAQNSEIAPLAGAALVAGAPTRRAGRRGSSYRRDLVGDRRSAAGRAVERASTREVASLTGNAGLAQPRLPLGRRCATTSCSTSSTTSSWRCG